MTVHDWYANPGGRFHGDGVTRWHMVWDTAWSWFVPTAVYAVVIAWLAQIGYAGYKRTRERMGW